MRRPLTLGATILAAGASLLLATASRADEAETPQSLLQEGAKLAQSCKAPGQWPKKKVSANFDVCNDALQLFVKAVELSKTDAKIVEAASPQIAAATVNKAASAVLIGRIYTENENADAALGFFRVACGGFEATSFVKPSPEQAAAMKAVVAETEQALQGHHRTCKTVAASE